MATGIPSGLGATYGFSVEGTVGSYQAPVSWLTFDSESMKLKKNIVQGKGLHSGLYLLANRRAYVTKTADGTIKTDLYDRGLGKIYKGMLGAATTPIALASQATVFNTVFTPADLTGYSLGMQIGKPGVNGTINAFSYEGCKLTDWTIGVNNTSLGTLDLGVDAWAEDVSQTYVAASYTTSNVLNFSEASVNVGGTCAPFSTAVASGSNSVNTSTFSGAGVLNVTAASVPSAATFPGSGTITVATGTTPATITYTGTTASTFTGCTTTSGGGVMSTGGAVTSAFSLITGGSAISTATGATIKGMNKLADARFYLNSAGVKAEQLANDFREISGTLDLEFKALADIYTAFAADTPTSLVLTFTGPTIAGSVVSQVQILIPRLYWEDASPDVEGPALLKEAGTFTGLDDGVNPQTQIWTTTLDSAL